MLSYVRWPLILSSSLDFKYNYAVGKQSQRRESWQKCCSFTLYSLIIICIFESALAHTDGGRLGHGIDMGCCNWKWEHSEEEGHRSRKFLLLLNKIGCDISNVIQFLTSLKMFGKKIMVSILILLMSLSQELIDYNIKESSRYVIMNM